MAEEKKGIYITWNRVTNSRLITYNFCFGESETENHIVTSIGSGAVFLPVSNNCNIEEDLYVVLRDSRDSLPRQLTQGTKITLGGPGMNLPEYEVTFHLEENYYYQNQKLTNEKGYAISNKPLEASFCLEDGRGVVESNYYKLDSEKLWLQRWNPKYFLKDIYTPLQLKVKVDNNSYGVYNVYNAYSTKDALNFLARMTLSREEGWAVKVNDKYYTINTPVVKTSNALENVQVRMTGTFISANYNWAKVLFVYKYTYNGAVLNPLEYDVWYTKKSIDNDSYNGVYPRKKVEDGFEHVDDYGVKLLKDAADARTATCIIWIDADGKRQEWTFADYYEFRFLGGNWAISEEDKKNCSFCFPEDVVSNFRKYNCDLIDSAINKSFKQPVLYNEDDLYGRNPQNSFTVNCYNLVELQDYTFIGYKNLWPSYHSTKAFCGPTAINCATELPVANRQNSYYGDINDNFISNWGCKLIRNVDPNTTDIAYKYKVCWEDNYIKVKRSDWESNDYKEFFSQKTLAKRFIIDIQAAGGSGASTNKFGPLVQQYPNGGGGGGAFVRLLVNLEEGDLNIGLEKTYTADDDRNSKHYTWVTYDTKSPNNTDKTIYIHLGNGGMGQLQSFDHTNGLGGKINFTADVNPNTDTETIDNLSTYVGNFNHLHENKIKVINYYYGKPAPEGTRKAGKYGKFNGAHGLRFISGDTLDNLNGTTTQIVSTFPLYTRKEDGTWEYVTTYTRGWGGISMDADGCVGGGGGGASVLGFGLNGKSRYHQDKGTWGDETNGFGGGGGGGVSTSVIDSIAGYWGQHGCFIIYW